MTSSTHHSGHNASLAYLDAGRARRADVGRDGSVASQLTQFLATRFDTTDMGRPHAYLVYLLYDNEFNIVEEGSGAKRVEVNPTTEREPVRDHLEHLMSDPISVSKSGFMHVYVSNGNSR